MDDDQPLLSRRKLPHQPPAWVPEGSVYFITICCEVRGRRQLTHPSVWSALAEAVEVRQRRGVWWVHLLLAMPDHVHALISFPPNQVMTDVVTAFKRWMATQAGVVWQRDFFDHRLRSGESFTEKAQYIRLNPVRAKLASDADEWPFRWEPIKER